MIKSNLLSIFVFLLIFPAQGKSKENTLPRLDADGNIALSTEAQKALKTLPFSEFKPTSKSRFSEDIHGLFDDPGASPHLMFGDFNGDQTKDAVALFENKSENVAILFIERNGKLKAFKIERWKKDPSKSTEETYVSLLPSSKGRFALKKVKTKRDLIQIETYMGAVNAYYFHNGKLIPYRGKVP